MCKRILLIPLVLGLCLCFVQKAPAADYGPWSPYPGQGVSNIYDPDTEPALPSGVAEQSALLCMTQNGQSISSWERDIFSQIVFAATDVWQGDFEFGSGALYSAQASGAIPLNGSYKSGSRGMQRFLLQEQRLLEKGRWTPYASRALLSPDTEGGENLSLYASQRSGWRVALGEGQISKKSGEKLATLLDTKANHPLRLTANLPEACGLVSPSPDQPTLQKQLSQPGDYLLDQVLYVPGKLASASQEFIQPHAFKYTFWTPHTERGDLMWEMPLACTPKSDKYFSPSEINDACQNYRALGFSESAAGGADKGSWFLSAARVLQWLISGTYILILFSAALIYIFRGSSATSLNIVRLLPRMFFSVLLVLFAGSIIGALVTTSNLLVQAIFEWNSAPAVGSLNAFLMQAGNVVGGGELVQKLVTLLVGIMTVFFFAVFLLASLLRQVLLVGLVVLAPLAAFSLIVPTWRRHFRLYARILTACILLPIMLAFVLKIGISINPLLLNPEGAYGQVQGLIGMLLVIITLWLMYKLIRLSYSFTLQGHESVLPASTLDMLSRRREIASPKDLAPLVSGPMLPALQQASSAQRTAPLVDSKALPASNNAEVQGNIFDRFKNKKTANKRISHAAARKYRNGYLRYLQERGYGEMNERDKRAAEAEYASRIGGHLKKEKGSWYLVGGQKPEGG